MHSLQQINGEGKPSRARTITTAVVLVITFFITLTLVPQAQPVTLLDVLRIAIPAVIAGLFFLLFPKITLLSRELTQLFIKHVANEITSQISTFSASIPHRTRRDRKKRPGKQKFINPMILDTSAIIDGRIEYLLATGFIYGTFLVPNFILLELQAVADSTSTMKRQRGRRGLEVLESIKELAKRQGMFNLQVINDDPRRIKSIDEKLMKVAKRYHAAIVTCDYNLNKVATVSGIHVLNVNELVNAVKTVTIPGESLLVKVVQKGKEKEQGVGYLEDGTMVVIEDGQVYVGSIVSVKVARVIQTSAGRMIFGTIDATEASSQVSPRTTN